jgi:soluble lytic murein transglycosylase
VGDAANRDPGLVYDRAAYLNRTAPAAARQLLAQRGQFDRPPANPEKLMELMVSLARGAANDGQARQAYEIASRLDDIYPAGTDVSQRSYGERDQYTNLAWLAGWTALKNGRAGEAAGMFDRYGRAAQSGQTRAKGFYWASRAAAAAGQADRARTWLEQAAGSPDQFYGLLALERMGRTPAPPPPAPAVTPAQRAAFARKPLVEAVRYLGASGRRTEQTQFVRALAVSLDNEADRVLAAEFGRSIGRPDLAVWVLLQSRCISRCCNPARLSQSLGGGARHHAPGKLVRPGRGQLGRRPRHDAADARHGADRDAQARHPVQRPPPHRGCGI